MSPRPHPLRAGFSIAGNRIAVPALLAPMSGVTDAPFRRIAHRFGAGAVVSEMIASEQLVARDAEAMLKLEGRGVAPHIVQLAGCSAEWMAEGARIAESSGADVIDINMGCPAKRVVGGWAGSALMRDLDHAMTLIEATVGAVGVPVTLKMRLGWDHGSINAPELARRAVGAGVAMVTVHGRTRNQFYTGQADWSAVRAVHDAVRVPLVVNGDISSADGATAALEASGADAVMVGRGAVGRPWIVGRIGRWLAGGSLPVDPPVDVQAAIAREHFAASLDHYGSRLGLRMVRKHLAAYLETALGAVPDAETRRRILAEDDPAAVDRELAGFYAGLDLKRAA